MQTVTRHEILRGLLQEAVAGEAIRYRILEHARRTVASLTPGTVEHHNAARAAGFCLASYRNQRDLVGSLSRQVGLL
ncbi:hypothetical protein RDV84_19315 [Lysobacter yananisis]|uniref:Uncharacterized protein n=1 Tax=Lysobacter yananisis TaxID=1003114 RepID=A0ABY9P4V2_9GAMM|nr:hypothetical protein [Lysobacter yananisis]WMT02093.1 hypothetical protein RDV84_19315 [Lysobacter yananisis]